ncbi:hypothetical protein Y032_0033g2766 [Ancylostoma ceylanicum]|uniref:Reverse transcriptase domain-containing protein n=1 Tax=Ancylostoma ceylanicum TaxID=53326 RepID=A0A016UMP6_9BILA|nr:hypothetical protein Y032_0033g2766 [Ancylostoma ceylanicum]
MRLRDRSILSHLKNLQKKHHICQDLFSVLIQYVACHQLAVIYNASIDFLLNCKHHRVFPNFVIKRFSTIPYQRNHEVQLGINNLKIALLDAAIAERRRRRTQCILSIVNTKRKLQSHLCANVWRRISDLNQCVCSRLRHQEQHRLGRKFEQLQANVRPNISSTFIRMDAIPPKRHTVIGTNEIDSDMAAVLNLGPSFAISPKINNSVVDNALCGVHQFAYRLRWRLQNGPTVPNRQTAILSSMPFPSRGIRLPEPAAPEVESRIAILELAIQRIYLSEAAKPYRSNLTRSEQRGVIKLLRCRDRLRFTVGDKCGSFVVMPQSMDKDITNKALSDSTTYAETTMTAFNKACEKVKLAITTVIKSRLGVLVAKQLLDLHPIVPTYYNLVKTHKLPSTTDLIRMPFDEIKTRPIISSCGGPSDRLSWLLVELLSPLLQFVEAHIINVDAFLASLTQCQIPPTASYASFDVVSLYTNVNNNEAIDAVISLYQQHLAEIPSMGFNADEIRIMLEAVLGCNVFCFNNKMYEQRRGLAMGNRIAPLVAIIFLDHIEKNTLTSEILLYKRYIDDVFVIGNTRTDVENTMKRLNSVDENVVFTLEEPGDDGFLPFLNARVKITNGQTEYLWYKKPSSSNILVHSRSAHPIHVKANVVRNLLKTKNKLCTTADVTVENSVARILEENGYRSDPPKTWRPHSTKDGMALVLPYVGDGPARKLSEAVKDSRLPIRLVFRPPPTLRDLLTSTRIYENRCPVVGCRYCSGEKICELRGTVYLLTCGGCGEKFSKVNLNHVFASPYDRTIETASIIVADKGLLVKPEPGLCEGLYMCEKPPGFWEPEKLKEKFPLVDTDYISVFSKHTLPKEGFGDDACIPRVRTTLNRITEKYDGDIMLVSHGAPIGAIHEIWMGEFKYVGQATVTKFIETEKGKIRMEFSSDASHLSDKRNLRPW